MEKGQGNRLSCEEVAKLIRKMPELNGVFGKLYESSKTWIAFKNTLTDDECNK
jgi:hypothetical protein